MLTRRSVGDREELGAPPEDPGGVGRPSRRSRRDREDQPKVWVGS